VLLDDDGEKTMLLEKHNEGKKDELKKCLTLLDVIGYGVASTVGAGVYVTTGVTANQKAGPGIVISFLLAGLTSLMSALCYSEFATRISLSGSSYSYAYVSMGEFIAFFVSNQLVLEYSISAAAVARGFSGNVQAFFESVGVELPSWLIAYELNSWFSLSPMALVPIVFCTVIMVFGVQGSTRFNIVMTFFNITVILLIIYLGAWNVNESNYDPFLPYGFSGVLTGTGVVFFSYVGFDATSTLASEVKNPGRDMPLGILGTLLIATGLYVGVSVVLTGMIDYNMINLTAPLADAFSQIGMGWAGTMIAIATLVSLTATTLCSLLGQPRIFYQMGKDGLLWPIFAKVNENQVPMFSTLISSALACLFAFFIDLDRLTEMISAGTLLAFTVVCGGVIVMRYRSADPDESAADERARRRLGVPTALVPAFVFGFCAGALLLAVSFKLEWPVYASVLCALPVLAFYALLQMQRQVNLPTVFICPLVPLLPCFGMLANIFIIVALPVDSLIRVLLWSAVGFAIYFLYGIHHSRLNEHMQSYRADRRAGAKRSLSSVIDDDDHDDQDDNVDGDDLFLIN
jgi:basic amino acid/polyamine antiporter, APA family